MMERLPNIHPSEVIQEDFLVPLGKTAEWLAQGLRVSTTTVEQLLHSEIPITPATALRLERFLGCSAEFWLGLQAAYDLEEEYRLLAPHLQERETADEEAEWQRRSRETEARLQQMKLPLAEERQRLVAELDAIQPRELAAA